MRAGFRQGYTVNFCDKKGLAVRNGDFQMGVGEMSRAAFTGFLTTIFQNIAAHSVDGAIVFACMDWRHAVEI